MQELTGSREECAKIAKMWLLYSSQQDETKDSNQLEPENIHSSLPRSIGSVAPCNRADASDNIRRYTHKLSCIVRIFHILDDGWDEQGEGIDWAKNSNGDEHVHPDLPVSQSLKEVFQMEVIAKVAIL